MANSESILLKMRGIRTAEEVAAAIAAGESVTYEEAMRACRSYRRSTAVWRWVLGL